MLKSFDAIATIAVKDIAAAKHFYEDLLGFPPSEAGPEGVLNYTSGGSKLLVYKSHFAGTNQATAATWAVDDVDAEAAALAAKGVKFEHYDFPGGTREGDVHVFGPVRNAWFRDADGNILSIVNRHGG